MSGQNSRTLNLDTLFVRDIVFKDFANNPIPANQPLVSRGDGGTYFTSSLTSTFAIPAINQVNAPTADGGLYQFIANAPYNTLNLEAAGGNQFYSNISTGGLVIYNTGPQQIIADGQPLPFTELPIYPIGGKTLLYRGTGETTLSVSDTTILFHSQSAYNSSLSSILELQSTTVGLEQEFSTATASLTSSIAQINVLLNSTGLYNYNNISSYFLTPNVINISTVSTNLLILGDNIFVDKPIKGTDSLYDECIIFAGSTLLSVNTDFLTATDNFTNVTFSIDKEYLYGSSTLLYGPSTTTVTRAQQVQLGWFPTLSTIGDPNSLRAQFVPITQQIQVVETLVDQNLNSTITNYSLKNIGRFDEICNPQRIDIITPIISSSGSLLMVSSVNGVSINYTGDFLTTPSVSTGFFVQPVRNDSTISNAFLQYNTVTNEIVWNNNGGGGGGGNLLTSNFAVAAGYGSNNLAYTFDGLSWTGLGSNIFPLGPGLCLGFNDVLWVAGGFDNNFTYSTMTVSADGLNYTPISAPFNRATHGIAYNGFLWVAVGDNDGDSCIAYSSDGLSWTLTSAFSNLANCVAWNGNYWLAGGYDGSPNNLAISYDGISWNPIDIGSIFQYTVNTIAWNGTLWVAGGVSTFAPYTYTMAYSYDGLNWINQNNPTFENVCLSVAWNGEIWVAGGDGEGSNTIFWSNDGANWTAANNNIFDYECNSVTWNGSIWIAVGQGDDYNMAYSYDGKTWIGYELSLFSFGGSFPSGGYGVLSRTILPVVGTNPIPFLRANYVAIGAGAGGTVYDANYATVAIGNDAGFSNQSANSIAIGRRAGYSNQGSSSVSIGRNAGYELQGQNAIAIGRNAGYSQQATYCIAIGYNTGFQQSNSAIAIGRSAASSGQGSASIAIGVSAGGDFQDIDSIAIGESAGVNQSSFAIAIGFYSGNTQQGLGTVAIGSNAGSSNQGDYSIAIGGGAASLNQGVNSVAIGNTTGVTQGISAVAIGNNAGNSQSDYTIAIGDYAGYTQDMYAIAIGEEAGGNFQSTATIAIGQSAGASGQNEYAIAIGNDAGVTQKAYALAIGNEAGHHQQGLNAIAIGNNAGFETQGENAIAIGSRAGVSYQSNASIVLNATGIELDTQYPSSFYLAPIRYESSFTNFYSLLYNSTTNEVTYVNSVPNLTENFTIAVGYGGDSNVNAIGYSYNGKDFIGLGPTSVFENGPVNCIAWNGSIWIAGATDYTGSGVTLGMSADGINWTLIGDAPFSADTYGIAWNGHMWIAVGNGAAGVTVALSYDGFTWNANYLFDSLGIGIAWNGSVWIAVGVDTGGQSMKYSYDGLLWNNISQSVFGIPVSCIAWNGNMWVAGGTAFFDPYVNTLGYSYDGLTWIAQSSPAFSDLCTCIAWNGELWVAGGENNGYGGTTFYYSTDGAVWTAANNSVFYYKVGGITWNGSIWIATGADDTYSFAYSENGIDWIGIPSNFFASGANNGGYAIASRLVLPNVGTDPIPFLRGTNVGIGAGAGFFNQGSNALAFGFKAGELSQGPNCIAIGPNAGQSNQSNLGIAIGWYAAYNTQGSNSVAIGTLAATENQQNNSVALGHFAGQSNQANDAVAIGLGAGQTNQGNDSVAIGTGTGGSFQSAYAIAIGYYAGYSQSTNAIAIGNEAGYNLQGSNSIAIGNYAGGDIQDRESVAIGDFAGVTQSSFAVAVGYYAGYSNQGPNTIAIGSNAGYFGQGDYSIAIGNQAGYDNQGIYSIALGYHAGSTNQSNNSIVINASDSALNTNSSNALFVAPIRNDDTVNNGLLCYNSTTKEVTYNAVNLLYPKAYIYSTVISSISLGSVAPGSSFIIPDGQNITSINFINNIPPLFPDLGYINLVNQNSSNRITVNYDSVQIGIMEHSAATSPPTANLKSQFGVVTRQDTAYNYY